MKLVLTCEEDGSNSSAESSNDFFDESRESDDEMSDNQNFVPVFWIKSQQQHIFEIFGF
jgi:hypothetical protein